MENVENVFLGLSSDFLIKIGIGILILIIGIILIKVFMKITRKVLDKSSLNKTASKMIGSAIHILFIVALILLLTSYFGISLTPLATLIGFLSGALIFALRGCVTDIVGGILIHTNNLFVPGNVISIDDATGKVDSIKLFNTVLKTYDNKTVIIPNSTVINGKVINETVENERRVDIKFLLDHKSNIDKVKNILINVAKDCPMTIRIEDINIGISGVEEGAICLDYNVWCKTEDYSNVKYYLYEEAEKQFQKDGIVQK